MKITKEKTTLIKECDKGGACVTMDAKFYNEMCDILQDECFYKQLEKHKK